MAKYSGDQWSIAMALRCGDWLGVAMAECGATAQRGSQQWHSVTASRFASQWQG